MNNDWYSYHVFIWDYSVFDDFIKELYCHMTSYQMKSIFFIRYWEGGPHLRIRFRNIDHTDIEKMIAISLNKINYQYPNLKNKHIEKSKFYKQSYTDGLKKDIASLPWYPNFTVKQIPYVQEIIRYGGEGGMKISDELFVISSSIVNDLLQVSKNHFHKIVVFYNIVNLLVTNIFDHRYERKCFFKLASEFWVSQKIKPAFDDNYSKKIHTISNTLNLTSHFQEMMSGLQRIYKENEMKNSKYGISIIISHIHMLANRFGISINTELACYIFFKKFLMEGNDVT